MLVVVLTPTADAGFALAWEKNWLTLSAPGLPGGTVRIHYLEAYLRSGSTNRDWLKSTIPHRTTVVSATHKRIELLCRVEPAVEVTHVIEAGADEVTFRLTAVNRGAEFADVQWAQPCIRVDRFTGMKQEDYFQRCFVWTENGPTLLHRTKRTDKARYVPGQVYVPKDVPLADVNPRPISPERPVNNLIGCYSADGKTVLATAFDHTQELFQGVGVCIHADFRLGGLKPGETKKLLGKIYWTAADLDKLKARYEKDFPSAASVR
jgi:hypothetical protein